MKGNTSIKKDGKGKLLNFESFRSCLVVVGYSTVLISVVFLTEILQSGGKGTDAVYAMSEESHIVQTTWEEWDSTKIGGEDWWIGSVQANLENVLRNSMHKYLNPAEKSENANGEAVSDYVETSGFEGQVGVEFTVGQEPAQPQETETQPVLPEPEEPQSTEPGAMETQQTKKDAAENKNKKQAKKKTKKKKAKKTLKIDKKKKKAKGFTNPFVLSKEDKNVLLRIVEAEATGEDIKGKMLVANVVLNRVKSNRFPNSVKQVVFQNNGNVHQFSPISDGRYWKVRITNQTVKAVNRVLNGEDDSKGALYFMCRRYAKPRNVRWFDNNLRWLYKYGTHEFFK